MILGVRGAGRGVGAMVRMGVYPAGKRLPFWVVFYPAFVQFTLLNGVLPGFCTVYPFG